MNNVYPSINEILPTYLLSRVPSSLVEEIKERYAILGPKYVTEQIYSDGRSINGCMLKSSVQDAIEEVVDAVFNTLVWLTKLSHENDEQGFRVSENAGHILLGLIEIYSLLCMEKEADARKYSNV